MEGAISQANLLRNGYTRPNAISRHNNNNKQQPQSWSTLHVAGGGTYTVHMVDQNSMPVNMKKASMGVGSDSGGSSTGEASPPPTQPDPVLLGNAIQTQSSGSLRNKQPLNLSRLNGGKHGAGGSSTGANNNNNNNVDFNTGSQSNVGTLVTSNSSGNLAVLIAGQMHNFPAYRSIPPPTQQQQQQRQFHGQPNGELMYTFSPPFLTAQHAPVVVSALSQRASPSAVPVPTPYPTNKMMQSCFNCGSTLHTGLNCSEASMEDVTRNAVYKLDYTVNAPPQLQFLSPVSMPSVSSTIQSANNNEPDPTITFIDLTQDTTSSSSSSSTSSIHGAK